MHGLSWRGSLRQLGDSWTGAAGPSAAGFKHSHAEVVAAGEPSHRRRHDAQAAWRKVGQQLRVWRDVPAAGAAAGRGCTGCRRAAAVVVPPPRTISSIEALATGSRCAAAPWSGTAAAPLQLKHAGQKWTLRSTSRPSEVAQLLRLAAAACLPRCLSRSGGGDTLACCPPSSICNNEDSSHEPN